MKNAKCRMGLSVLLLTGVFALSSLCFADQTGGDTQPSPQVTKEVKEALQAIKEYSVDKRDEAVAKAKTIMAELDGRIQELDDRIQARWDRMDQSARRKARATLKSLREKRNDLAEWSGGVKHSSARAWDHVKKGFLDSYASMQKAFERAEDEFHSNGSTQGSKQ